MVQHNVKGEELIHGGFTDAYFVPATGDLRLSNSVS